MAKVQRLRIKLEKEHVEEMQTRIRLEGEIYTLSKMFLETADTNRNIIQTLQAQIRQNTMGPVAFFVHSENNFGPVTVPTNIPFPVENVNIGGGWMSHIDAFQAPASGHYFFFTSARSDTNSKPHIRIVHTDMSGDNIAASFSSNGDFDSAATAAIIYVEVGDYVSVQLDSNENGSVKSSGGKYTTFSGFFLN